MSPSQTPLDEHAFITPAPIRDDHEDFRTLKQSLSASLGNGSYNATSTPPIAIPGVLKARASPPLFVDIPRMANVTEAALAALRHLPAPLLVLSSLKTVLVANKAIEKLLGLNHEGLDGGDEPGYNNRPSKSDVLQGQTLSQIGIDMIGPDGQPIWVNWEVRCHYISRW